MHHLFQPQCFQYRVIEINGHWRHWHAEIIGAWRDRITNEDPVIYDLVHPDPPRVASPQSFLFDIIVAQGLDAPRRGGLVTILQRDNPAHVLFAVAVSLPELTSGYQIAQSAEYTHECNIHRCIIRHAQEQLPYTMTPVHQMQDGDSFVVTVATSTNEEGIHLDHNPQDFTCNDVHDDEMPEHDDSHDIEPEDLESQVPSPSAGSTPASHQGVHIHRLGHNQIFARPRWDTVEHILWDVALIVGIPFDQLSHCHHLHLAPNDVAEHEDSIIIQHINDIPPAGSTEQMVLVDVEMHSQQSSSVVPRAPAVSRQVHRVVPTLVRRHLLLLTRTAAYCDWHPQECIVFCNRHVWNEHDIGPRRITHGMYFRIILPPPPVRTWEISRAVKIFHEAFELFDHDIAGRVAEHILNENQVWPPVVATDADSSRRECKGADLEGEIDVPIMLAPSVRNRRPRPVHDGTERWLWELGHIFSSQATAEAFEDEIYLYVQTWYIDHERYAVCRTPRPIRLARHSIEWIDDFRHEWRDLMDPSVFFSIHVVKPRPPQLRHHGYACHILLEQNRPRGSAAGILTAILESYNRDAIIQGAFSTPRFLRRQDIVDLLEVERFCTGRRCSAYYHHEPVHLILATEVDTGFSRRLTISPPADQLPRAPQEPGYFDEIVFMQVPSRKPVNDAIDANSCATDLPVRTAERAQFDPPFIFNPNAAVFVPGSK